MPQTATKTSHAAVRDMYKVVLLATQYGMQAETLAARLSVSTFEAHEMLNQHRSLFATYWRWSDDWVAHALDTGKMSTVLGWECTRRLFMKPGGTLISRRLLGMSPNVIASRCRQIASTTQPSIMGRVFGSRVCQK
jgi:hypothetical protein